jgi:dTDP-4-dehydrorhamnose reductase
LATASKSKVIHISTDCVFSGANGFYSENDVPDALDLYGISKLHGEIDYLNTLTIRTSIIGHELSSNLSLVDWFLAQEGAVKGYKNAIFSGLPNIEIARVILDYVIPKSNLSGLIHLSANPISKYDLLMLISEQYRKSITIIPDFELVIDRSLNSDKFRNITGYIPPNWPDLIRSMHDFNINMV